ncbi:MAG: hypothetical protein HQL37_15245 [Alphaproteobacteria bacterium]|nr:hypothetical protein [Alphaproteobacteria bacterium]
MSIATFDKLIYLETLKASGIPDDQARAHAHALDEALRDAVATKADIFAIRSDMELLKRDLTIRLGTMLAASVAIVATVVKLLSH